MNCKWMAAAAVLGVVAAPAMAKTSYLKCEVQTTFRKPFVRDTDWVHVENKYTKYFQLDNDAKMVSSWNWRSGTYTPICNAANKACAVDWKDGALSIDGTKQADNPSPHIDFRRSIAFSDKLARVKFVIGDYGDNTSGKPNMTWTYDGHCAPSAAPKATPRPPGGGAGSNRPPTNPNYEAPTGPAMAVSQEEADKALAGYYGNTMTGFSGGGHWFHMWFLEKNLAFAGDDEDMSSEGKPRIWSVGKDSTGYRLCGDPIPATGAMGCYPLPPHKVGDSWIQHDMDGDPMFQLLPGRQ
ncbi:MAG TPA: hypothetical protein VMI92_11625 [Steroidobacteraceae bacterium]|nr:hypothetical protein [Steroidobacteraceae bacterium]